MAHILPYPVFRAISNSGTPLVGAKLYTYEAGTSTPQAAYTDHTEETEQTNPIVLNSNGEAAIWLGEGKAYKLVLTDADDVLIWTQDNVSSINDLSISTAMLKNGVLANSTAGRLKMEDGYLSASIDGLAKMANGFFQATPEALAKFAAGFFADSDTARAKFANGFLSATESGLALMADGFLAASDAALAKMADGYFSATPNARAKFADGLFPKMKMVALGEQISASSGTFSTTSGTPVDVTNLSVTITTTGRRVFVGLIPSAAADGSVAVQGTGQANGSLAILRGGSAISTYNMQLTASASDPCASGVPPGCVFTIDDPPAGTYTYKLQAVRNLSSTVVYVNNAKLVAYEL